jgi:hypothetical protein
MLQNIKHCTWVVFLSIYTRSRRHNIISILRFSHYKLYTSHFHLTISGIELIISPNYQRKTSFPLQSMTLSCINTAEPPMSVETFFIR